jgi:predicted membrane channel-forming protein YqfA (hemolysin III family)
MIEIDNISPEALANLPQADPFSLFIEGLALPVLVISGVMLIIGFILYNWPHSEIPRR